MSVSLVWPGMGKQLGNLVQQCRECYKDQVEQAEPLILTILPPLPWQRVRTDLFEWKNSSYFLIADYYSCPNKVVSLIIQMVSNREKFCGAVKDNE